MSELGVLTQDQEALLGKKLDGLIDFGKIKGLGFVEMVDGFFFTSAIRFLDNTYADKLGESYKESMKGFITALLDEDWVSLTNQASDLLDALVDVPLVDGEEEHALIVGIVQTLVVVVGNIATRKAEA